MSATENSGYVRALAEAARDAGQVIASLDSTQRQGLIDTMADAIADDQEAILAANADDLARARLAGITGAMLDRLALDPVRLANVVAALREIARLPDPVGQVGLEDIAQEECLAADDERRDEPGEE